MKSHDQLPAPRLTDRGGKGDIGQMQLIDQESAENYLRRSGRIDPREKVTVRELTGGVSNMVLLIERSETFGSDFVLKQARAQLRTQSRWYSDIERVWREADVLRTCSEILSRAPVTTDASLPFGTPQILFEDRDEYILAMTAAPRPNIVWKAELLAGTVDLQVAAAAGALLGSLHAASWQDTEMALRFGDRTLFEQLRIDPYYRTLAANRADAKEGVKHLLVSLEESPRSLVHADFSPKNLLISSAGLFLVDFETGHYGDPAFDLGFFLSHLLLKACQKTPDHARYFALAETFRAQYDTILAAKIPADELSNLWTRGVQNLAGCAWARLDGKSPVEYLTDLGKQQRIRRLCREVFEQRPCDLNELLRMAQVGFGQDYP